MDENSHQYAFFGELIRTIIKEKIPKREVTVLKNRLAKKHGLRRSPTDIEVMLHADEQALPLLQKILLTKPTRTISGVVPVALMTKPIPCKHGRCTYCPGGPGSVFGNVPMSYTGNEPSTMRAMRNQYDSYLIAFNRLEQYVALGHPTDKVESIIQGGTFTSFDQRYQESFIRYMYKAYNDFSSLFYHNRKLDIRTFKMFFELPGSFQDKEREQRVRRRILRQRGRCTLEGAQDANERAVVRCVALCLETRPDWSKPRHIHQMLRLGTTRVELGVQSVYDDVARRTNRSHTVKDSILATRYLKDSLLKVGYHLMLGLPGVSRGQDWEGLMAIVEDPDFRPDQLKIYPCMVMPGTPLERQFRRGEFTPIPTEEAAEMIAEFMRHIPKYMRVMRVQRDIPTKVTVAGVDRTNLRQYVDEKLKSKGIHPQEMRAREPKDAALAMSHAELHRMDYEASKGHEVFLSFEAAEEDTILGFCRLRIPYRPFRPEIKPMTAGIRELHVYGPSAPLGNIGSVQHRGLGKKLMEEAERIAREEFGMKELLVISGVGAREYYRKLGYLLKGAYMQKRLR